MTRQDLIDHLNRYETDYPEEQEFIPRFLELLKHPRAYYRDHLPGHITASALIIDDSAKNILLLHHKKLDRWLQPGGHADGDENVFRVAKKEVMEETGLQTFNSHSGIFDIDIHEIPARSDFREHYHFDIRFLIQAEASQEITGSDESHALKWFPVAEISKVASSSDSILRMVLKAKHLFTGNKQ